MDWLVRHLPWGLLALMTLSSVLLGLKALSLRRQGQRCLDDRIAREREVRREKEALLLRQWREEATPPAKSYKVILLGASHLVDLAERIPPSWGLRALGGWTSQDLRRVFPQAVAPFRPRILGLALGLNDPASRIDPSQTAQNLRAIAQETAEWGGRIQLLLPLPAGRRADPEFLAAHKVASALKERLQEVADAKASISTIDGGAALMDKDGWLKEELTVDGLHLNGEGKDILWAALEKAIREDLDLDHPMAH